MSAALAFALSFWLGVAPVRLNVTSTTHAAWHAHNGNTTSCDDNYGEGLERLNLSLSSGSWVAGLRLDVSLYHPVLQPTPPTVTTARCHEVELRSRYANSLSLPGAPEDRLPEKVWGAYSGRLIEVTLGDSYVSFGRGLTLSLRKTDELGLDTTQRGLRVQLSGDRLSATLIGGFTNINNVDEASGRYARDPNDGVLGATAEARLLEAIRVGGSAAMVLFRKPVSTFSVEGAPYREHWLIGGPKLEAPRLTDWLGVYLEGVGQRRAHADGTGENGYGLYAAATASLGRATLLVEAKAYGDLAVVQPQLDAIEFQSVQYTAPPTLERVQQPLEHPQRNVAGARARADWELSPDVSVYVNHGLFRDWEGYLHPIAVEVLPGTVHDPYLGVDALFGAHRLHAQTGARFVLVRGTALRADGHLAVDVVSPLGTSSAVEVHAVHLERSKVEPFVESRWREGTLQLGYRNRPRYAVSAILDYTTEKGQPALWYPGASGEWDFTEASNVRLFVGSSRGGLRCVSGVCRTFPPFSGVKAVVTLRY